VLRRLYPDDLGPGTANPGRVPGPVPGRAAGLRRVRASGAGPDQAGAMVAYYRDAADMLVNRPG